MNSNFIPSTRVYTNIQDLKQLEYKSNSPETKKEVAQQFEAIFIQMVLSSMRDANKAFSSDLFGSNQMEMYQDIFDKQLALVMSNKGVGFAELVEKNIDRQQGVPSNNEVYGHVTPDTLGQVALPPHTVSQDQIYDVLQDEKDRKKPDVQSQAVDSVFGSPEEFMKKLWSSAKLAAGVIGAAPEILLAQAALETNWGRKVIPYGKNASTHNLFNIKAGTNWTAPTSTVDSYEDRDGALVKEKSNFRSYGTYLESFFDYVNVLKQNDRYKETLSKASDPAEFVSALQKAGFATDHQYAEKIMNIFMSPTFQNWVSKLKAGA